MAEIREPNSKDQAQTDKLDSRMQEFVDDLVTNVKQFDIDMTEVWRVKMQTAHNQRQGIKRVTNFPYPGAPNIPLPETDKLIKKAKPNFVLAAISGKEFMTVNAMEGVQEVNEVLKDKVRKANIAMNFLFKKVIPWKRRLTLAADHFLSKGFVNFKTIEKFSSRRVNHLIDKKEIDSEQMQELKAMEREEKEQFLSERYNLDPDIEEDKNTINDVLREFSEGKERIEFTSEEVSSLPDVLVPNPEKVFVPKGTTDITNAVRITHEFFVPEHKLIDNALKGIYDKDKLMKLIKEGGDLKRGDDSLNEKQRDRIAGVDDDDSQGELYRIHEVYTWFQPKDDEPFERWVFTFMPDVADDGGAGHEAMISHKPYPFEFEGWNWDRHDNEIVDDNHYRSRGIPEQIRSLQEFMERSMNNNLIRDEITNAPMYTVLSTSKLRSANVRFLPGQKLPVENHDEIRRLDGGGAPDVSSDRIVSVLKAWAEEYVGSTDQLFRNATNRGGGNTLGEVDRGLSLSQSLINLDVMNWLDTLSRVYTTVFNIMKERLVTPLVINGESITREDFQFEPDINANGSLEQTDKALMAQKALARLQLVRQAKGDGVATLEDVFNAYRDYLEKDGVSTTDNLITDPATILQEQITNLEQQAEKVNGLIQQQNQVIEEGEKALDKTQDEIRESQDDLTDKKQDLKRVETKLRSRIEELAELQRELAPSQG